ncbi:hypothetical protein CYLTODRAFT_377169, partial [Cylindrobasidium torrendii FP15055 ss-10]
MHLPPSQSEVFDTAKDTVETLKSLGYDSYFVGGVACSLFGTLRSPNDIDIVVVGSSLSQEALKQQLVSANPKFYTVASKDPYATYRVLWYRLGSSYSRRSCKVDLLQPGVMNIPHVPTRKIVRLAHPLGYGNGFAFPAMPFIPLLLLKLQAWQDHGESTKTYMRMKQPVDVRDLADLLTQYATKSWMRADNGKWVESSFMQAGRRRIRKFLQVYPSDKSQWRAILLVLNEHDAKSAIIS